MTRLGCHRFRSNEVRLWLSVIAFVNNPSVTLREMCPNIAFRVSHHPLPVIPQDIRGVSLGIPDSIRFALLVSTM